jgi:hypothetical protein
VWTKGITQAFQTGELWGINSQVFSTSMISHEEAVGIIGAEKFYSRALENYAFVATSEMKLRPPFVVEVGAVGLKGVYMGHRTRTSQTATITGRSVRKAWFVDTIYGTPSAAHSSISCANSLRSFMILRNAPGPMC